MILSSEHHYPNFICNRSMKRLLFIIIFLQFVLVLFSANKRLDSLLIVLDKTVQERSVFEETRIFQLNKLKKQISQTLDQHQKFILYRQLFQEYRDFQTDSALHVANKTIELAHNLPDEGDRIMANLSLAEALMVAGMYKESLDIVNAQNHSVYNNAQKAYSYHINHSIYIQMADYSISEKERRHYKNLEYQYKDSILSVLNENELGYLLVRSSQLVQDGKYNEALSVAKKSYSTFNVNDHDIALSAYTLSEIYHYLGDKDQEKIYLAISSIEDLKAGVKEYISLRKLAILLYEDGDIDRAYTYIKCSMEDAIFCNARLRTLEISQMLPIINTTYDLKTKGEKDRLVMLIIVISVLLCILIVSIIYIYKQLKTLARTRRSLKDMNDNLKQMNDDLNNLNTELSESNLVKEEYIGYVFNMCSVYIDKLDEFRKKVNRKLKAGQGEELFKMTNTSSLVNDELKEFYKNFDTIFLNLYPNFVDDFNSLLMDHEHIYPKEGELLSPELRIYALVRLGITDSVKIASFLHYSTQTVYNYRLKVRNKAKVSKDSFPAAVKQIGQIRD